MEKIEEIVFEEKQILSYYELADIQNISISIAKARLIEYYLTSSKREDLVAIVEICTLHENKIQCEYHLMRDVESMQDNLGKVISMTICALGKKGEPIGFNSLSKVFNKIQDNSSKMLCESQKDLAGNLGSTASFAPQKKTPYQFGMKSNTELPFKKLAVTPKLEKQPEPQKKLEEPMQSTKPEEPKPAVPTRKPKLVKKADRKPREENPPSPKRNLEPMETETNQITKRSKIIHSSSSEDEALVEISPIEPEPQEEEIKEVKKERIERKTRTYVDDQGYMVTEDYEEKIEYTVPVKARPKPCPEPEVQEKKPKKKIPSNQMSIMGFFKK